MVDVFAVGVESSAVRRFVPDVLEPGHRLLAATAEMPRRLFEVLADQVSLRYRKSPSAFRIFAARE